MGRRENCCADVVSERYVECLVAAETLVAKLAMVYLIHTQPDSGNFFIPWRQDQLVSHEIAG
jgi:hypothetical protein